MKGGLTRTSAAGCGLAVLAGASSFAGDTESSGMHPRVKMETTLGDIVLELDAEKAPISTLNFIQYAQDKYYDGTIFHRVMAGFMIQGGGFTVDQKKTEGLREGIKNEWKNELKNRRGTIAMARMGGRPDSATAQFFINVVDNASLNQARDGAAYAVFGKVVEGMETVDKIRDVAVEWHSAPLPECRLHVRYPTRSGPGTAAPGHSGTVRAPAPYIAVRGDMGCCRRDEAPT